MQALVCPLWKLLELFANRCLLEDDLLGWVVFFDMGDDALLGLLGLLLLSFFESAEKSLQPSLNFW